MERKPNFAPAIIIGIFTTIIVLVCGLTNYKSELLICNKTDDICKVEKTNLFNMKSEKEIAKFSQIETVSYFRQKIKGNRYGKGYKEYMLTFSMKDDRQIQIFSKSYYEKEELNSAIKNLKNILNSDENVIKYSRGD